MSSYQVKSPAKLNLHLEILSIRPDGFHDLQSVFQLISLADEIKIRILPAKREPFSCSITGPFDFPAEKNHIYKAAYEFHAETGLNFHFQAEVLKNIPEGGGLGGGSGNAATVLTLLNSHFGHPLSLDCLSGLGLRIGSDVPFFLSGGAALVRGRGEKIVPIPVRDDFHIVLIRPPVSVNTGEAYRIWDSENPDPPKEPSTEDSGIIRAYGSTNPEQWPFQNSFFNVLAPRVPVLAEIREILYIKGSDYANLTGSGSCLFGMFKDREKAEKAVGSLESRYPGVQVVAPVETVN